MPDERTRTHARLAEILQARVDGDPSPRLSTLSRLAFHWNAAHDLPHTLAASVRAGVAAQRLGASEAITQFERALSLWDRVPDVASVAGHPQAEIARLLAESAYDQGDFERGYTLLRTAVDLLGPDPDRLLASRVYSTLGQCHVDDDAAIGRQEAIRRAVEYAGDSPTEVLARALTAQSQVLNRHGRFADSVEAADRAIDVARAVGCVEAEQEALYPGSLSRSSSAASATDSPGSSGPWAWPGKRAWSGLRSIAGLLPRGTCWPGRSIVVCPSPRTASRRD